VHRSKLVAALADVPADLYDREVTFWSGALGRPPTVEDTDPDYSWFGEVMPGFIVMVQRVGASARVHLDIEADDVEAEVQRLEALGAQRVEPVKSWWVMRDPAGLLFCVVRVQTDRATFERLATVWE
jgi:hypothetical protein